MKFLSLEPFVPSGKDFDKAKQLFLELGFTINWENDGYAGFQKDACRFILQHYEDVGFAQNFMLSIKVDSVGDFRKMVLEKGLPEKFGVRITQVINQSYGKEVSLIDIAGVCWHFVEQ